MDARLLALSVSRRIHKLAEAYLWSVTMVSDEHTLPGFVHDALSRIGSLFDMLFETAEDAVFLMDGIRFVDCNPETLRMFGCSTKEEIVGQTPFRFSPDRQPDGAPSATKAARLVSAAMNGAPQQFEWQHCQLDGTTFDVEVRLNRFMVGGTPFLVAVVRDISARKRADAALKRQVQAEELINRILSRCAECTPPRFDEHMAGALRELAAFLGADHAYFLVSSGDRATYSCTHEMCGPGVAPLRSHFQNVRAGSGDWIEPALLGGKTARGDARGDGADVGCRSFLHVPTSGTTADFAGVLGVDSHARHVTWSDSDVVLCSIVGNALTGMVERKRGSDRLLEEKRFSERLIDSLPGIFYLFDADLRLRRWNRNFEVLGYDPATLLGMSMEHWLPFEEERRQAIATAQGILQRGGAADFLETEVQRNDGSVVPFLFSGARVDSPTGPMLIGVGINVAARRQAEKALAASERNYRELFNATNEALVIHDKAGRVLDFNERACTLFGFDASRARAMSINDLSLGEPPYSQREALEKIRAATQEGPQVFDWRSRRCDGTLFWSEVALRAFQSGQEQRIIASVRDITGRKRAALERERLMAEVQAASSAKDQFLAVLSHELRNPLAAIQASAALLRRLATSDEPRLSRAVDIIERNVRLQARFVNDLLDLSRLVRGKLTIQRAPVQLGEVVLGAAQACQADATRAGVALEMHAQSGLWINADSDRIQQVVLNLVGNGIKFTPKGGRVKVSVVATNGCCQVIVEDTGAGIEADRLKDLFQMFQQGQIAAQRAPGLGIGLALVKSLVELHGGRVWAESAGPGRGSRFVAELPRCEAPEDRGTRVVSESERTPMKMLLVEDNNDTRAMLAETFARLDCEVVPAESAEVALNILQNEAVDVILADIGLPGMDGYEFLRRARRLPLAARSPAFALTGYGQESDVRRAREAGYVDHFIKPLDVEEISRRIRSHLKPAREAVH